MSVLQAVNPQGPLGLPDADHPHHALWLLLENVCDPEIPVVSLREMGVGDMGIARHIKKMAKALFGRAEAYEAGLAGNVTLLIEALKENVDRRAEGDQHLSQMADYLARAASHVGTQDVGDIVAGKIYMPCSIL